jgi:hypothetical protein
MATGEGCRLIIYRTAASSSPRCPPIGGPTLSRPIDRSADVTAVPASAQLAAKPASYRWRPAASRPEEQPCPACTSTT